MYSKGILLSASLSGHLEIIKYGVQKGITIHADYFSIVIAALNGHLEIVKYLTEQGVDPRLKDDIIFHGVCEEGL